MLKFIEHEDDPVINICDKRGDAIGDLVINNGKYKLSLMYLCGDTDQLRQIADKLDGLNKPEYV